MNPTTRNFQKSDKNAAEQIFSLHWNDPEFLDELSDEIDQYINSENADSGFIVVENHNEIVGVAGYRKLPDYLKEFSKTDNPIELYVIAVKHKRHGIGLELKSKLIENIKDAGFTEILLFSPETHRESWAFHDTLDFKRVGEVTPPEDGVGMVWRRIL